MKATNYIKKDITGAVADVDTVSKSVKIVLSKMGNLDRDNDIILLGAFNKTIAERGPKGTNEIWHLIDHRTSMTTALGKFKELYVEGDNLVGISAYKDTALWRDQIWTLYESGDINQHSIGFTMLDYEYAKEGVRLIKDVALWEGSAVLWGANPNTPTQEVSKALHLDTEVTIIQRIEAMQKAVKKGDIDNELFNIELMQIKALLSTSEDTTEPPKGTLPEAKKVDWGMIAALVNI